MGIDVMSYRIRIGTAINIMYRIAFRTFRNCHKMKGMPQLAPLTAPCILQKLLTILKCFSAILLGCTYFVIIFGIIYAYVAYQERGLNQMISDNGERPTFFNDYLQRQSSSVHYGTDVGLCISSIGSVAFVGLLLMIAGVEPNPGPGPGPKDEAAKSHQSSPETSHDHIPKQEVFQHCKSQSDSRGYSQNKVVKTSSDVTTPKDNPTYEETVILSFDKTLEVLQKVDSVQLWEMPTESSDHSQLSKNCDNTAQDATKCSDLNQHKVTNMEETLVTDTIERPDEKEKSAEVETETRKKHELNKTVKTSKVAKKGVHTTLKQKATSHDAKNQAISSDKDQNKTVKSKIKQLFNPFKKSTKSTKAHASTAKSREFPRIPEEACDDNPDYKNPSDCTPVLAAGTKNTSNQEFMNAAPNVEVVYQQKAQLNPSTPADNSLIKITQKKGAIQVDLSKLNITKSNLDYILQQVTKETCPVKYISASRSTWHDGDWCEGTAEFNEFLLELQKIEEMNLSRMGLVEIPKAVGELHQRLVVLNISRNKVCTFGALLRTRMPAEYPDQMKSTLETLVASFNKISTIPKNIHQLVHLKELQIDENPIYEVVACLSLCKNLRKLKIGSRNTRVIATEVLVMKDLRIDVAMKHQKVLSYPTYEQLTDEELLRTFCSKHDTDLKKNTVKSRKYADVLTAHFGLTSSGSQLDSDDEGRTSDGNEESTVACYGASGSSTDYRTLVDTYLKLQHTMYTVDHENVSQLSLQGIPMSPTTCKALQYSQKIDKRKVNELILSDCHDFLEIQQSRGLMSYLGSPMFDKLQSLNLSNVGLQITPDLEHLTYLVDLNLNDNKISSFGQDFKHTNLRSLEIAGNPVQKVDIDVVRNVPNLSSIALGSNETKLIGGMLLDKAAKSEGSLEIKVLQHGGKLIVPPVHVVHPMAWKETGQKAVASKHSSTKKVTKIPQNKKVFEYIRSKRENVHIPHDIKAASSTDIALGYRHIITEVNTTKNIHTLTLTGHKEMCHTLQLKGLENMMNNVQLAFIRKLSINKCGIQKLPNLANLEQLECLDASENDISTVCTSISANLGLRELQVDKNPILFFDIPRQLKKLERVTVGSPQTRYIASHLLKDMADGKLRIEFPDPDDKDSLVLPSKDILDDENNLKEYIENKTEAVSQIANPKERHEALLHLLESEGDPGKHLSFSKDFVHHVGKDGLKALLTHSNMNNVTTLKLRKCGLTVFPNLDEFISLLHLDIAENDISEIGDSIKLPKLTSLNVEHNPLEVVDLCIDNLPDLEKLTCGSQEIKIIGFSILEKISNGNLQLDVIGEVKHCLILPTSNILDGSSSRLRTYVEDTEIDLSHILDIRNRKLALLWLVQNKTVEFKSLYFADQPEFCAHLGTETLQRLFKDYKNLQNITMLSFKNCNLTVLPSLTHLINLECLDLDGNDIVSFVGIECCKILRELHLVETKLEGITDLRLFPSLSSLRIGSKSTKYLGYDVLGKVCAESLQLKIDETYKHGLVYPEFDLVIGKGKEEIGKFVEKCELDITHLNSDEASSMLNWYTTHSSTPYKGLRLSGAIYLTHKLRDLLHLVCFQTLQSLYLDNCSLRCVPDVMHLKQLDILVLSNNDITDVKISQIPLSVKTLCLDKNPIRDLDLDVGLSQDLRELKIGSGETRFISFAMLESLRKQKVAIQVPVEYRDALLMPPFEVLNAINSQSDYCHRYMHNPEMHLGALKSEKDREEALDWLLNNRPKSLTTLDFAGQSWITDQIVNGILGTSRIDHIGMLNLSNCQLRHIPNLGKMCRLAVLDIRDNMIQSITLDECLQSLTQIFVSGNPVGTIDFHPDRLPNLERLEIGSGCTEFISMRLLKKRNIEKIIVVQEKFKDNLIFPSWNMLNSKPDQILRIVSSSTLDISWLHDHEKKEKFVDWILKMHEVNLTCCDFSNQEEFIGAVGHSKLEYYLSHPTLKEISELKIGHCNLKELPNLDGLVNLKSLQAQNNGLGTLPQLKSLETIDVSGNPTAFNCTGDSQPNLKEIFLGHSDLHFLDFNFLRMLVTNSVQTVIPTDEYKDALLMPPCEVLADKDKLTQYLLHPELFLESVEDDKVVKAFTWLTKKSNFCFSSFTMENMEKLLNNSSVSLSDALKEKSLSKIHTLNLNSCNLIHLPDVSNLSCLNSLHIDKNKIESLADLNSTTLTELFIVENPITSIDINMDHCKQLRQLTIGSYRTKYIRLSVLKQASNKDDPLVLNIEKDFVQNIILPPYKVIQGGPESVSQYLNDGVFDITGFGKLYSANDKVFLDALEHDERHIRKIHLSKGQDLLKMCGSQGISKLLGHKSLQTVESISLCNTDLARQISYFQHRNVTDLDLGGSFIGDDVQLNMFLQQFPKLKSLLLRNCKIKNICIEEGSDTLQCLDLRSNHMKIFEINHKMASLSSIHLEGNPIKAVNLKQDCVPCLANLVIGSHFTRYVGFGLLESVVAGTLDLKVLREYTKALHMPPNDVLDSKQSLQAYLTSPEKYLAGISDAGMEEQALDWLLENKPGNFTKLDLSGMTVSESNIQTIFRHGKVQFVQFLDLSDCSLDEWPQINHLSSIKHLNLSNNQLKSKGLLSLELPKLEVLDISDCCVKTVDLNSVTLLAPKLRIVMGSKETRYIALSVLKRNLSGQICLQVKEDFQSQLVFPPYKCLISVEELSKFVEHPEKELLSLKNSKNTKDTLDWMLKARNCTLENLNLSGYGSIYEEYGNKWLADVLSSPSLREIKSLNLASCNLKSVPVPDITPNPASGNLNDVPDITSMRNLERLNLSNNKLTKINGRLEFPKMKHLTVTGNPLERMELVDFGQENVLPNLEVIECGSSDTKYIGLPILQRAAKGNLKIVIPPDYREFLILPPHRLIEAGPAALNECVKQPEKFLKNVDEYTDKKNTLLWLRDTGSHDKESFDLSGQKDICEDHHNLNSVLDSPKLFCIKHLNLSDCGLWSLPDLTRFQRLETLNFSSNCLATIDYEMIPSSVSELKAVDNPIEILNVNSETHTKLTSIEAGSDSLRFLPSDTLNKHYDGKLHIILKDGSSLLMPPLRIFNSRSSLEHYLRQPEYFLREIKDVQNKQKALEWLIHKDNRSFNKDFTLSGQDELCSAIGFQNLMKMFDNSGFKTLKNLSMDGCGMREFPDLPNLTHLKMLNLARNEISDITVPSHFQLRQVEELYIDENTIRTIDFDLQQTFPSLKVLRIGSKATKFISMSLYKECRKTAVDIEVNDRYRKVLLFPSYDYMQNAVDKLDMEDTFPEIVLNTLQTVEDKHEMLHWLLEDDKNDFTSFSFSHLEVILALCTRLKCQSFLAMKSLTNVKSLYLDNCGLERFPDLSNFSKLTVLHLQFNKIHEIATVIPLDKLEYIQLQGNPISDYGDLSAFPSLSRITLGSKTTQFLGHSLLQKTQEGLYISVDEQFKDNLLLPPSSTIKFGPGKIDEYLQGPEKYVRYIHNGNDKKTALIWLLKNWRESDKLDLSNQGYVLRMFSKSEYVKLFKCSGLLGLKKLYLHQCQLAEVPPVEHLKALQELDLSGNKIEKLPEHVIHPTLQTLIVDNNPLSNIALQSFPNLNKVSFGSTVAFHVDSKVLDRVARGILKLEVPKKYAEHLKFPPYRIVQGGTDAIRGYLENDETDLSAFSSLEDVNLCLNKLDGCTKSQKSLRLSFTTQLSSLARESRFQDILQHRKLADINRLFIDSCNLENYPLELPTYKSLQSIDLSNNKIDVKNLQDSIPKSVLVLKLRSCCLNEFPNVPHLQQLNLSANEITALTIECPNLRKLNVKNNPLRSLDIQAHLFPKLKELTAGSKELTFVSYDLLQKTLGDGVKFTILPDLSPNILLPPHRLLTSFTDEDLKDPIEHLAEIPDTEQRVTAFKWLVETGYSKFETLHLSGQIRLVRELSSLFELPSLQDIKSLDLSYCDLSEFPLQILERLHHLQVLNLSSNGLNSVPLNFRHQSLKKLCIENNSIETLSLKLENMPELNFVKFGSGNTCYVGKDLLLKAAMGSITLEATESSKHALKYPPYEVVVKGREAISRFLANDDKLDLSTKCGPASYREVKTLLNNSTAPIKSFILSGQKLLCKKKDDFKKILNHENLKSLIRLHVDQCNLTEIPDLKQFKELQYCDLGYNKVSTPWFISTALHLPCLKELYMCNCGLDSMCKLSALPLLKYLDISHNNITNCDRFEDKFTEPHPLEVLFVDGNRINQIKVNTESFPYLKHLKVGSKDTRYISFNILQRAAQNFLSIEVPSDFKEYLLVPNVKYLENGTSELQQFLNAQDVDFSIIRSVSKRITALNWYLDEKHRYHGVVKSLVLTGQKDFCQHSSTKFKDLFKRPVLQNLENLYMDDCGLETIPIEKSQLPQLKYLNLSHNKLTDLTSLKSHAVLEKLFVEGNPIKSVNIRGDGNLKKDFPSLRFIQAGSEYTTMISPKLLEAAAHGYLEIKIEKEYERWLFSPPHHVLTGGPRSIKAWQNDIKNSLKSGEASKSTAQNVLMLLGRPEAGKTSLLDTMRAKRPCTTGTADRTVVLEQGVLNLDRNLSIRTYDFGGHDIYELEYPIFLRGQKIIALIVIDIENYDESKHDELVTRWLENCILCADCNVLFVLSKCEGISQKELEDKKKQIKQHIHNWKQDEIRFLEEVKLDIKSKIEKRTATKLNVTKELQKIKESLDFFKDKFEIEIFETSAMEMKGIDELKESIAALVETRQVKLGDTWMNVLNFVSKKKETCRYHLHIKDIMKHLAQILGKDKTRKNELLECLKYFHKTGEFLWYEGRSDYIYNNVRNMLILHKQLFRHDLETSLEYHVSFRYIIGTEDVFNHEKAHFLSSGFLSIELLKCIWSKFNLEQDELEAMIHLIKINNLCFDDDDPSEAEGILQYRQNSKYLRFPWFIQDNPSDAKFWRRTWPNCLRENEIEFQFVCTFFMRFPSTLYERFSVKLHNPILLSDRFTRRDWANGVYIQIGDIKILVERTLNPGKNPLLTVKLRGPSNAPLSLWNFYLRIYNIVDSLVDQSPIVTYSMEHVCPHCILTGRPLEEAARQPLGGVTRSRCGEQLKDTCDNADIDGHMVAVVPAAVLFPLTKDCATEEIQYQHIKEVEDFCKNMYADYYFSVSEGKISDPILRKVSAYMSNVDKAYDVGLNLGLKDHEIQTIRTDNSTSIQMTSYNVLQNWKKRCIKDGVEGLKMISDLIDALKAAKLCDCITDLNLGETAV